jgi:hypothetical protein
LFDISIFLGDFNYRINLQFNEIKKYFVDNKTVKSYLPDLIKYDQMRQEIENGKLYFNKFCEEKINFLPTYKLLVNSDNYVLEEGGDRIPGWTDRIL